MKKIIFRDSMSIAFCMSLVALILGGLTDHLACGVVTALCLPFCGLFTAWAIDHHIMGNLSTDADLPELRPLRVRLEAQTRRVRESAQSLEEKERDLSAISDNMKEGLILMDKRGCIISMNRSAASMLAAESGDCIGRHIFAVSRHPTLQSAVLTAQGGTEREEVLELGSSIISIYADPVRVNGVVRGVVLLLFDVTDKMAAEQLRREFTANVSHELKTPLTTISGYAELLQAGMVQAGDVQQVGGLIWQEARRLVALIDDIIDLSQLDEAESSLETEPVELLSLAREVQRHLQPAAEKYGVELRVEGEAAVVQGNRRLLEEMISNLAENALKYNRPGGYACITVYEQEGKSCLSVSDNGIGIAREHQGHVFERFYRVDKSRSKSTGGTGLGLSIVKHGAAHHGAEVELESRLNKGTSITIRFPRFSRGTSA